MYSSCVWVIGVGKCMSITYFYCDKLSGHSVGAPGLRGQLLWLPKMCSNGIDEFSIAIF